MVAVPRFVAPLVNVTVPVALAGNVAVNVTDWLTTDGFTEDDNVIVGEAWLTVSVAVPVAELLAESPP